jgi:hypothetical protein
MKVCRMWSADGNFALFGDFNDCMGVGAAAPLDASSKQLSVVEIPVRSLPKIPERDQHDRGD